MTKLELNSVAQAVDVNQFLTFMLSGEEFAVPIMQVKEIIEYHGLTVVPMVPKFISGALNLRGNVIPVINLATKLDMPTSDETRRTSVVIMEVQLDDESTVIGVMVDRVLDVIDIAEENIDSAPSLGARIRTDFIRGMGKLDGDFVIILEVNKILSSEEIAVVGNFQDESEISPPDGID